MISQQKLSSALHEAIADEATCSCSNLSFDVFNSPRRPSEGMLN